MLWNVFSTEMQLLYTILFYPTTTESQMSKALDNFNHVCMNSRIIIPSLRYRDTIVRYIAPIKVPVPKEISSILKDLTLRGKFIM